MLLLASLSLKHPSHCAFKWSQTSGESLVNAGGKTGGVEETVTLGAGQKSLCPLLWTFISSQGILDLFLSVCIE